MGSITALGGAGGSYLASWSPYSWTSYGGNGSGGAVWLRATSVTIAGTIDVGNGVLRIDAHEINAPGLTGNVIYGSTEGLPPLFELHQSSSGVVEFTNNSSGPVAARLVVIQ